LVLRRKLNNDIHAGGRSFQGLRDLVAHQHSALVFRDERNDRRNVVVEPCLIDDVELVDQIGGDDFLAPVESELRNYARAPTSSAAGLFQFVDQTWLKTVWRYGGGLGLAAEAAAIRISPGGRAEVASPLWRAEILALRYDPAVSARLAGALTRQNASALRLGLGRSPTAGELYAAHLLGSGGALLLLSADRVAPAYPARLLLPAAAATNRALFYLGGAPRSVHEVAWVIADRASGDGEP
jgi:hypothetical protein